jgi:hypothetical protein
MALTGYGEESYGLRSVLRRGCAEGRSPFAGGLGVSPGSLIFPQEWGTKGVETRVRHNRNQLN